MTFIIVLSVIELAFQLGTSYIITKIILFVPQENLFDIFPLYYRRSNEYLYSTSILVQKFDQNNHENKRFNRG